MAEAISNSTLSAVPESGSIAQLDCFLFLYLPVGKNELSSPQDVDPSKRIAHDKGGTRCPDKGLRSQPSAKH
jgi:hypothetical protein